MADSKWRLRSSALPAGLTGLLVSLVFIPGGHAKPATTTEDQTTELQVDDRLHAVITEIARQVIPHTYEDRKKWGQQKKVLHGLYVKREGLRLKTHRQWKSVNHGRWTRYRIALKNIEQQFDIRLDQLRWMPDGSLCFEIFCTASLDMFGRLAEWRRGVQLISLSVDADADVELTMHCRLNTRWETVDAQPALVFEPTVQHADLQVRRFRLRRVSQLHGPMIQLLSHQVRELLEDQIQRRRSKIVIKINRQIDKQRDLFRLSLTDWAQRQGGEGRPSDP